MSTEFYEAWAYRFTCDYCVSTICDNSPDTPIMALQLDLRLPSAELPDFGGFVPAATDDVSGFHIYVQGTDLMRMPNHKTVCISL